MSKEIVEKNKGGRPPKVISEDMLRQIEALAGYGLNLEKICHVIDISYDTLKRRVADTDRVLQSIKRGRALAEGTVGKTLFEKAKEGDTGSIIWWEKTRADKREYNKLDISQKTEHSGTVNVGIEQEVKDAEEFFAKQGL